MFWFCEELDQRWFTMEYREGLGGTWSSSYSSWVNVSRSLRSAPAQNAWSLSLAMIKARVLPSVPWAWSPSTTPLISDRSCRESALRDCGRLRERTVMVPECGAGMLLSLIVDDNEVL